MNNSLTLKGLLACLLTITTIFSMEAQVQLKLILLEDGKTYQVSMIPEKTWEHPYNITSTAQITLKVPTETFEVKDLKSLQLGINWSDNSRSDAPAEAPEFDYISFGLNTLGTVSLDYVEGQEMPLFTFRNALPCQGTIALMDNKTDSFMAPNSRSANVGNSITILGARGEAYTGNVTNFSSVACRNKFSSSNPNLGVEKILTVDTKVYPNPALNEVFVDMNWKEGATGGDVLIMDATGKEVKRQAVSIEKGFNKIKLDVEHIPFGIYAIEVEFDGKKLALDRFVKGIK